jgi:Fe2+ or Zn2+ uptake regulation protein
MIVCSCAVVSDHDIELAVLDIMSEPNAPLPTPGVVYRYLEKRMDCCACAPLAVETIYAKMDALVAKGLICPCACASAQDRMVRLKRPAHARARECEEIAPHERAPDLISSESVE